MIRKSLLAAAAVMALLAGAALTQPAGAKPQAQRPGACTAEELAAIREGFGDARERAEAAIRFIGEHPDDPHIGRYFGATPRKVLREHFRLILDGIGRADSLTLVCHDQSCGAGTFAFVRPTQSVMGFCRAYFAAAREGKDSRGGIIVHEVSHLALNTRDAEYQPEAARLLAKDEPHVAAMNADNYEYFVEFLPR